MTLAQVGSDVVVQGTGTLNTTDLTLLGPSVDGTAIRPIGAVLSVGAGNVSDNNVDAFKGITKGPTKFGPGGVTYGTGTGDRVVIIGDDGDLDLPADYVSGSVLSDTATFSNATFASLGFTPGTYVYTWGTGANADSLTVTSAPEPSTWALLGLGMVTAGILVLRHRRAG